MQEKRGRIEYNFMYLVIQDQNGNQVCIFSPLFVSVKEAYYSLKSKRRCTSLIKECLYNKKRLTNKRIVHEKKGLELNARRKFKQFSRSVSMLFIMIIEVQTVCTAVCLGIREIKGLRDSFSKSVLIKMIS